VRKFACIEPLEGKGDLGCSGYLWRSDRAGGRLTTRGISEPMLELDLRNLRGEAEYVARHLSILGGNRSSLTSANLGQAYARVFSDRAVSPRLISHDAGELDRIGMERDVWRKVRDGMAGTLHLEGAPRAPCALILVAMIIALADASSMPRRAQVRSESEALKPVTRRTDTSLSCWWLERPRKTLLKGPTISKT